MADLTRTVEVIFGAIDNTGPGLASVGNSINEFNDSLNAIAQPLADVGDKVLAAQTALLGLAAAFSNIAVNESVKLTESLEEIGSLVNATPDDVNLLRDAIQDFALTSTSNFDQIQQAVYDTTSALGSTETALAVLKIAEEGAIVGATDLANSSNLLTNVLNAYGLATGTAAETTANAERVMATMFTTVQNGKTTIPELSENIGKVASTAASAKVPIEVVGAAIAALTGAGIGTDQAMTLLGASLKELLTPSDALKEALGGVSVTTNGLPAVLDRLKIATGGSSEKFFELFGSAEAAKGALILANDSSGKFKTTLDAMPNSIQTFNTNLGNMKGGVEDAAQQLENAVTVLLQKVGLPLEQESQHIREAFADLFIGLSSGVDQGSFDVVIDQVNRFGSDLAETIQGIANALPAALDQVDFSGLIDSFEQLGINIGGIFDGLDLTQPDDLAAAIQSVIDTFTSLTNTTSGIVAAWTPVIQLFTTLLTEFNKLDPETQQIIGAILGVSQVFTTFSPIIGGVADSITVLGNSFTTLRGLLSGGAVAGALSGVGAAGVAAAGGLGYAVGTGLSWAIDEVISRNTDAHLSLGTYIADLFDVGEAAARTAESTIKLDKATADANVAARAHSDIVEKTAISSQNWESAVNQVADSIVNVSDKTALYNASIERAGDATLTIEQRQLAMAAAIKIQEDILSDATETQSQYNLLIADAESKGLAYTTYWDGSKQAIKVWDDTLGDATATVEKNLNAQGKLTEQQRLAIENAQELTIELEKLASNERIRAMEFKVELDIEKVKAAAEVMTSILDSTQSFFESSGTVISSLVEGLSNAFGFREKEFFKEQIQQEMDLRQQEIDLQYAVLEAQERMFQSQLDLNREGLNVKITSDGLDADLEKIMITILNRVRTTIVGDYSQFLLASGA